MKKFLILIISAFFIQNLFIPKVYSGSQIDYNKYINNNNKISTKSTSSDTVTGYILVNTDTGKVTEQWNNPPCDYTKSECREKITQDTDSENHWALEAVYNNNTSRAIFDKTKDGKDGGDGIVSIYSAGFPKSINTIKTNNPFTSYLYNFSGSTCYTAQKGTAISGGGKGGTGIMNTSLCASCECFKYRSPTCSKHVGTNGANGAASNAKDNEANLCTITLSDNSNTSIMNNSNYELNTAGKKVVKVVQKSGKCSDNYAKNDTILQNVCSKGSKLYNYLYSWTMNLASEYLSYGEAGAPGEYKTTKATLTDVTTVIPGYSGTWKDDIKNGTTEYNTSGKDGASGGDTTITSANDKLYFKVAGGAGGKGGLKTEKYYLCQAGIDKNTDNGCKDRDTTEIVKSNMVYSEFNKIRTAVSRSGLTLQTSTAGSGGFGGATESKNNFVKANRIVENIKNMAGDNPVKILTDNNSNGFDQNSHIIKYHYESPKNLSGNPGAVIITW